MSRPLVEAVEGHEDRWRHRLVLRWVHQEVEAGDEGVVEHAHLSVQDQRGSPDRGDRRRDVCEPCGVVAAAPADEADTASVLVGGHAPAVVLLLVDVAIAVEWLGEHGLDQGEPTKYAGSRTRPTGCGPGLRRYAVLHLGYERP
jgi:hypothetical protein